jgi:drug/metabolite transporter (DMT)-like permease
MPATKDASKGVVLILLASLCFGVCGPFAKSLIHAGLNPLQVTWLRVTGVGVILVIVAIPVLRRGPRPKLWGLIAFGLTAIAGVQAFYFVSVSRLPVGVALLLEFTGPIVVVAWVRWVRRTRLPRAAVIGSLLSLAGLAVVVEIWAGLRLDALGLAAGAGAAACQAAYFLGGERLSNQVDIKVMLGIGFAVGAVALTPLAAPWSMDWSVLAGQAKLGGLELAGGVLLAALVVSTGLAYATGLPALRLLSAPVAGAMGYSEVVVAALAAWLLLGEALTVPQIIGGLLVIAGVFTAQRAVSAPKSVPAVDALAEPGAIGVISP